MVKHRAEKLWHDRGTYHVFEFKSGREFRIYLLNRNRDWFYKVPFEIQLRGFQKDPDSPWQSHLPLVFPKRRRENEVSRNS